MTLPTWMPPKVVVRLSGAEIIGIEVIGSKEPILVEIRQYHSDFQEKSQHAEIGDDGHGLYEVVA